MPPSPNKSHVANPSHGRPWRAVLFVAGVATAAACRGPGDPNESRRSARVELVVTHAGKPITAGQIDLVADVPGNDVGGEVDASGCATIAAIPGRYTVVVGPPIVPPAADGLQPSPAHGETISAAVRSATTSPWKIDVVPGKNRFEFDLDIDDTPDIRR